MSYTDRKTTGNDLETRFKNYLDKNNLTYMETGSEILDKHCPQYYANLCKLSDAGCIFAQQIRYCPDICVIRGSTHTWFDLKRSACVERTTYEAAQKRFIDSGDSIFFLFQIKTGTFIVKVQDIQFVKPNLTNNAFGIPTEGIWRNPRMFGEDWSEEDYKNWRGKYPNASGCCFGVVDFEATPKTAISL